MKKYLTFILFALVLTALASVTSAMEQKPASDAVVVSVDSQGNITATSHDGDWDVLICFGDPDDGITGNRGEASGSVSGLLSDTSRPSGGGFWDLLERVFIQWHVVGR